MITDVKRKKTKDENLITRKNGTLKTMIVINVAKYNE